MFGELLVDIAFLPYGLARRACRAAGGTMSDLAMIMALPIGTTVFCLFAALHHEAEHKEYLESVKQEIRAKGTFSNVHREPLGHWFCGTCRAENRQAEVFNSTALATMPDITRVTVKPIAVGGLGTECRIDPEVKQVIVQGKEGEISLFMPANHEETTLTSPTGQVTLKLTPKDLAKRTGIRVGSGEQPKRTLPEKTGIRVQSQELPARTLYEKTGIKVSQGRRPNPVFKQYARQYA